MIEIMTVLKYRLKYVCNPSKYSNFDFSPLKNFALFFVLYFSKVLVFVPTIK